MVNSQGRAVRYSNPPAGTRMSWLPSAGNQTQYPLQPHCTQAIKNIELHLFFIFQGRRYVCTANGAMLNKHLLVLITSSYANLWFTTLHRTTGVSRSGVWALTVFAEEIPNEEVIDDAGPGADGDVHVVSLLPEAVQVVVPVRVLRLPRRLLRQPPALRFLRFAAGGRLRGRGGGRASEGPEAASIRGSEGGVGVTTAAEEVGVRGGGGEGGGRHGWVWPRLAAARACDWLIVCDRRPLGEAWRARTALGALSVTIVQQEHEHLKSKKGQ